MRIGRIEGELVVNPSYQQLDESSLDLIVVGTRDALTMIEAGGDQVPEETMLEAFELAHGEIIRICDAIDELAREVGKPKWIDVELNAELAKRREAGEHSDDGACQVGVPQPACELGGRGRRGRASDGRGRDADEHRDAKRAADLVPRGVQARQHPCLVVTRAGEHRDGDTDQGRAQADADDQHARQQVPDVAAVRIDAREQQHAGRRDGERAGRVDVG